MSRVKNKNTDIELLLKRKLRGLGIKYRTNYNLPGKPDIILQKEKIAIFCDGDFWHGKNFKYEKDKYNLFWKEKIQTNIKRDKIVDKTLKAFGWKTLRFWGTDIRGDTQFCTDKILEEIGRID